MKKTRRITFRLSEEDQLLMRKVSAALLEPNTSKLLRLIISREYVALKNQGKITDECHE